MLKRIRNFLGKFFHSQTNTSPGKKPVNETQHSASIKLDAEMWVEQSRTFAGIEDWKKAKECATEAIKIDKNFVEAYMIRALAFRVAGEPDKSIEDYTKVVEIDPQNGEAWMFRGACKTQKASSLNNQQQVMHLLNDAHPDYQRAAELMPDNEQAGLALLELELCTERYREAVGTTGLWWNRIQISQNKLICAWLGSIAFILAGKSAQKWADFWSYLESDSVKLNSTEWSLAEINGLIQKLESQVDRDEIKLQEIQRVHNAFIKHYSGRGPAINK